MIGEIRMNDIRLPTTIDINQIISWNNNNELVLKPVYQRNKVWNESAKSYLIDSVMRNYPIPPIFIREKLNLKERKTVREVVDGQQRISALIDFYENKFPIKKSQNKDLGGLFFNDLSEEAQERFLTYKIIIEKITEKDDSLVFDMFARLNSNSIPLNKQELRNAKYTGEFKVLAYNLALAYRDMFVKFGIFTSVKLSRMIDVEFISVIMMEYELGIIDVSDKIIDKYYSKNEEYPLREEVSIFMYEILDKLNKILPLIEKRNSKFFSHVYIYDLVGFLKYERDNNIIFDSAKIANRLNLLDEAYDNLDMYAPTHELTISLNSYKDAHQRHSTNKDNKIKRIDFLKKWIYDDNR